DAVAQMLDVLGLAPPAQRADHVRAALERELGEMAAHKTRDSSDQNAHEPYPTPLPNRLITRRNVRRSVSGSASAQTGFARKMAHQGEWAPRCSAFSLAVTSSWIRVVARALESCPGASRRSTRGSSRLASRVRPLIRSQRS